MKSKIILLDSIRSMQNIGAIFRNADGAGFTKIFLCGQCATPPRGEISKTALGSEETIDWEYFQNITDVIFELKKEGYNIFSLEVTPDAVDYREFVYKDFDKVCLVVGNEVTGVSQEVISLSEKVIYIPMLGQKTSLNVSVAAGIVMYALV